MALSSAAIITKRHIAVFRGDFDDHVGSSECRKCAAGYQRALQLPRSLPSPETSEPQNQRNPAVVVEHVEERQLCAGWWRKKRRHRYLDGTTAWTPINMTIYRGMQLLRERTSSRTPPATSAAAAATAEFAVARSEIEASAPQRQHVSGMQSVLAPSLPLIHLCPTAVRAGFSGKSRTRVAARRRRRPSIAESVLLRSRFCLRISTASRHNESSRGSRRHGRHSRQGRPNAPI